MTTGAAAQCSSRRVFRAQVESCAASILPAVHFPGPNGKLRLPYRTSFSPVQPHSPPESVRMFQVLRFALIVSSLALGLVQPSQAQPLDGDLRPEGKGESRQLTD